MSDTATSFARLEQLMDRLRDPGGCPWDRKQTLENLRSYLLEEACEVVDAMDREDWPDLLEELGDLQFQIVFVSRIAREQGKFDFSDVAKGIHDKMVRRHPHVFDDATAETPKAVADQWESIKRREAEGTGRRHLDGVPPALPALVKAYRVTEKAAGLGFDWRQVSDVLAKVHEELAEVEAELPDDVPNRQQRLTEEIGDLLFAIANLGRKLDIDPERALALAIRKFRKRFDLMEQELTATGRTFEKSTLEEMNSIWDEVKKRTDPGEATPKTDQR